MKLREISPEYASLKGKKGFTFRCPGCETEHIIYVGPGPEPVWQFNGDLARPTFNPSLLVRWPDPDKVKDRVCHSFIRDGKIQYLTDSTHALAGQTVEIPDVPSGA